MSDYTLDFALACEGVTDHAVLRNILLGFFKGHAREPRIKAFQPYYDATGESDWMKFGNWEHVLRYLEEGKYHQALEFAEYLVIQIDTDCSEHVNLGVPQHEKGKPLAPELMVNRVVDKLRTLIGPTDFEFYGTRLIFAVCVRDLECWLLPLWVAEGKKKKTTGCLHALNAALASKNEPTINPDDKKVPPYDNASKGYRKRATLIEEAVKNPSLEIFLDELMNRKITLAELD